MAIQQFPKWLYAAGDQKRIVQSQEELEALGEGWYTSPADVPAETPAATIPTPEDFSEVATTGDEPVDKTRKKQKG